MDAIVGEILGAQHLRIAALQVQVEDLTEQLAAAKQTLESKAPMPLHDVKASR
jgi:hypothetical protein